MKKIALLLAACLLFAMLPAPVLADEVVSGMIEETPPEVIGVIGADGIMLQNATTPQSEIAAMLEVVNDPDPAAPVLEPAELTLGVGEQATLTATPPEGATAAVSFRCDDETVATVSEAGVVTAVAPGEAAVLAGCDGGPEAICLVHVKNAPDAVRFSVDEVVLGKGELIEKLPVVLGEGDGECAGAVTVTCDKPKVAKVYPDGSVKGLRVGTAVLTARTYNGLEATCALSVKKAPYDVALELDAEAMGVGETAEARLVMPENAAGGAHFESSEPGVVEVDPATGALHAVAVGEATIRATTYNEQTAEAVVTVKKAPKRLTLKPAAMTLGVGMALPLKAALNKGAAGKVTITSDDADVAAFADGEVTGVAVGETVVRAETYNGLTAECAVSVRPAPESVSLPWKKLVIGIGEIVKLKPDVGDAASTFTYTTSNKSRVRAFSNGKIKGMKTGTAYVKVKTYNGKTCKLKVVVRKAPKWVKLSKKYAGLAVGERIALTAKLPSNAAGTVKFTSSKPEVAQVDPVTGEVVAVGSGSAVITAKAYNGVKATCKVKVYPMPEWIETSVSALKLGVGQSARIEATLSPGSRSPIEFSSRDASVAAVDDEGLVTARATGDTKIDLATNAEGVTAEVDVKVLPAPDSVRFAKKKYKMNVGETLQLKPIVPSGTCAGYSYETDDAEIATVSETGEVFAAGRGTATVTVTTHNGLTASTKVKVYDPTYPEAVTLTSKPVELTVGETFQLEYTCEPETAEPQLVWTSNDEAIVTISEDGLITALSSGYVIIGATSVRNPDIQLEFKMSVARLGQTLVIPARQTDIPGVAENLRKIEAIRSVAINEVNALYNTGSISGHDAWKRRDIINNIFKDYAFPWMTPEYQPYWKWENSEGGLKDFKPDIMYYGMPYISGSGNNRRYNRAKALSESRYTDTGRGYYMLNRQNLLNGKYVGNDCSGLVDQAIWGTDSSHSGDRTADIAVSSAYRTISDYSRMRPGDLLCKANAHVIMFLYYTDDDHTKMMFIENGGSELGTNTVHCLVGRVYYYKWAGYKVRRLSELG